MATLAVRASEKRKGSKGRIGSNGCRIFPGLRDQYSCFGIYGLELSHFSGPGYRVIVTYSRGLTTGIVIRAAVVTARVKHSISDRNGDRRATGQSLTAIDANKPWSLNLRPRASKTKAYHSNNSLLLPLPSNCFHKISTNQLLMSISLQSTRTIDLRNQVET